MKGPWNAIFLNFQLSVRTVVPVLRHVKNSLFSHTKYVNRSFFRSCNLRSTTAVTVPSDSVFRNQCMPKWKHARAGMGVAWSARKNYCIFVFNVQISDVLVSASYFLAQETSVHVLFPPRPRLFEEWKEIYPQLNTI